MPSRHVPAGQFSIDVLKLMQTAYDSAYTTLKIDGLGDPQSAILANVIIDLAAKGKPERLLQRTLETMSQNQTKSN